LRSDLKKPRGAKLAATIMSALFILGFFLIVYSKCPSFVSELKIETFASSSAIRIPVFLPDGGWYSIKSTNETTSFGDESRMRVYDSKETLVFSGLVSSFPSNFKVDSSGHHTVFLENVSLSNGERFLVYREVENYRVLFPFLFLDIYGQTLFIIGSVGFAVLLPIHYFSQRKRNLDERAKLKGFIAIPKLLKMTYAILSSILFPWSIIAFINIEFGQVTVLGLFCIYLVSLLLIMTFWYKIEDIFTFYLLKVGYGGYLANGKGIKRLILVMFSSFLFLLLSMYINDARLSIIVSGASLWIMLTSTISLCILVPFFGSLTPEGEAFLSLEEFLSDYRKKGKNADFGYIEKASKCIAAVLADKLFPISSVKLSEHIVIQHLDLAKGESDQTESFTIKKLQKSLDPLNLKKLASLISTIPDIREEHPRLGVGKLLQRMYYLAVIATTLITAIKLMFRI